MSIWGDIRKRGLGLEKKEEDLHQDKPRMFSHAEGTGTYASGSSSYAEGVDTYAVGRKLYIDGFEPSEYEIDKYWKLM